VEYPDEDALNIYTDGSMLPEPWRGGLAGRVHSGRLTGGQIPADIVYGARKMEVR
jgi:hypothetical protein